MILLGSYYRIPPHFPATDSVTMKKYFMRNLWSKFKFRKSNCALHKSREGLVIVSTLLMLLFSVFNLFMRLYYMYALLRENKVLVSSLQEILG